MGKGRFQNRKRKEEKKFKKKGPKNLKTKKKI